jgi:hypothetical protein
MILDEKGVDVNVLMQQPKQEDLHGGIKRRQRHKVDVGHNEGEANLEGIELLGSNQRMKLEAYLRNTRTHRK